jgi:transcription antitermination factor NusG
MLGLSENPPILPPTCKSLAAMEGQWWIGHTKSRCEKAFAWDLLRRGVNFFLPMVERVTISSGKKRKGMVPVFPSYVFFCGNEEARYTALTTDRLCQVIKVVEREQLVVELTALERAVTAGAPLDFYPQFEVGRRCRVKAGAFRGLEGVVLEKHAKGRLLLFVSILRQGASLEIDADLLEPIEEGEQVRSEPPLATPTGGYHS